MKKPNFISNEDIIRWSKEIDNDQLLPKDLLKNDVFRELCMAGLYLYEELEKLNCPKELIVRIQYSAGKESFGKDIWQIHKSFLDDYSAGELKIADDDNLN